MQSESRAFLLSRGVMQLSACFFVKLLIGYSVGLLYWMLIPKSFSVIIMGGFLQSLSHNFMRFRGPRHWSELSPSFFFWTSWSLVVTSAYSDGMQIHPAIDELDKTPWGLTLPYTVITRVEMGNIGALTTVTCMNTWHGFKATVASPYSIAGVAEQK
jgi:hypothetical protein